MLQYRSIPYTELPDHILHAEIYENVWEWDMNLSDKERKDLVLSIENSIVSMKMRCMTRKERERYLENKRKMQRIESEVKEQVSKKRLKTHHFYV